MTAIREKPTVTRLRTVADDVPELGPAIPLIIVFVAFSVFASGFLGSANLKSVAVGGAYLGIIAVGQTILLVAKEFDLSVGSVAGMGSATSASLMAHSHWPWPLAVAAGLAVGALTGLVNGLLVVRVGLPAFIVTLGMLFFARGAALVIANGQPIYPLPHAVTNFGADRWLGLQSVVWVFIIVAILGDFVLRRTGYGRRVYATGGNVDAAALSGIKTNRVKLGAFVATGFLASLAGIMVIATIGRGEGSIGTGWELSVIAAVVVGGVSLFGGVGTVLGGVLGLVFLQIVSNGLVLLGVDSSLQPTAVGAIMIAAVGIDAVRQRRGG